MLCLVVLGQCDNSPLFPDWEGLTLGANMCIFAFTYLSLSLFPSTLLFLSEFLACISTLSASLFYASYVLDPCLKSEVCLFLLFFFESYVLFGRSF